MDNVNLEALSREDLARYMVTHRGEPGEIEARRIYICRFAEKAKERGIDFYRQNEQISIDPNP